MTTNDLDGTRETIDANSKCGTDQLAGDKTETANFEGFFVTDPEAGVQVTAGTMRDIFNSGEVRHWRYISEDGETIYREFNGSITAFTETFNNGEAVGFSGAISVSGDVIDVAPTNITNMNTNVNIAGRTLLLDMGALEIMAEAVGTHWSNPLEGITELKDQAALIIYGGLARKNEDDGIPTQKTHEDCKKLIRSMVPADLIALTQAYTKIMAIPDDGNAKEEAEEKKANISTG